MEQRRDRQPDHHPEERNWRASPAGRSHREAEPGGASAEGRRTATLPSAVATSIGMLRTRREEDEFLDVDQCIHIDVSLSEGSFLVDAACACGETRPTASETRQLAMPDPKNGDRPRGGPCGPRPGTECGAEAAEHPHQRRRTQNVNTIRAATRAEWCSSSTHVMETRGAACVSSVVLLEEVAADDPEATAARPPRLKIRLSFSAPQPRSCAPRTMCQRTRMLAAE